MANKKTALDQIQDFAKKNPELLFMVANPTNDEIFTSYAGKYSFVRFEEDKHVVLRVVSPDMFELSIDEFAGALMKILGTDEKDGAQFIKAIGGAVKSIGEAVEKETK